MTNENDIKWYYNPRDRQHVKSMCETHKAQHPTWLEGIGSCGWINYEPIDCSQCSSDEYIRKYFANDSEISAR